jgi:c-di-GMP-binding flagellar brake protein YcgR
MNHGTIIVTIFLSVLLGFIISLIFRFYRTRLRMQDCINTIRMCSAHERRRTFRSSLPFKAFVATNVVKDNFDSMEFRIRDISSGGLYIYTERERLTPFTLGEEINLVVDNRKLNYYNGKVRVVHSEAVFNNESIRTESGFGVMFLNK